MARTKQTSREPSAQSWTRCRVPIGREIPYISASLGVPTGWFTPLEGLVKSPGYDRSVCLRNIDDAQDILFLSYWKSDTFLKSFLDSPAFQEYLKVFGFQDASTPGALFSTYPSIRFDCFTWKVTIFTYSFTYPVPEENRDVLCRVGGLEIDPDFTLSRLGSRDGNGWIREPQIGKHGQLVEKGMVVQSWPDTGEQLVLDIQEAVSNDEWAREILRKQIEDVNPLEMEETTWYTGAEKVKRTQIEIDKDKMRRDNGDYDGRCHLPLRR